MERSDINRAYALYQKLDAEDKAKTLYQIQGDQSVVIQTVGTPDRTVSGTIPDLSLATPLNVYREFETYEQYKRIFGSAGKGRAWYHIVEQHEYNVAQFGSKAI